MNAFWQQISASWAANRTLFRLGFIQPREALQKFQKDGITRHEERKTGVYKKVHEDLSTTVTKLARLMGLFQSFPCLADAFNLPYRLLPDSEAPSWLLWVDATRWNKASLGNNENHPFETAEIRLASTIVQGLLALPHHPEMPFIAVVGITQHVTQLAGVLRYAKQAFNLVLVPLLQGLWTFQHSLPYQAWLNGQYNQLRLLSHLLKRANTGLNWQTKLKKALLKCVFAPLQLGYTFIQHRLIQASLNPSTNEGWQGQGLCFGLIDFLNSPLNAKEPHPPTIIYFTTEFDTQLLLDEELHPVMAEILPQVLQPADVLLMPSYWHQSQFLANFPVVNPQQVSVLYPCVDSLFKLTEDKRKALKKLAHTPAFLETVGLPADAPFFLVVVDKDRSFRWFHTVLAGFECFHDIREADAEASSLNETTDSDTEPDQQSTEKKPSPPTHLVIVGLGLADFPAYQKLLEEALPANLQARVHLHGNVPSALLLTLYASAKGLFYVPAERELGLGLSVLEALVVQCPVVISKVGHLEEWSQKASLLLEPHEPLQVAFAMAQLMDETALADALRHNGRKRSLLSGVEEFTQQLLGHFGGSSASTVVSISAEKVPPPLFYY